MKPADQSAGRERKNFNLNLLPPFSTSSCHICPLSYGTKRLYTTVHIATHSLLRHIYAKTVKGQDEIVRPKFGLNPRQRRLLSFVDGVKALSALHENFPVQEMEEIIMVLSGEHFIQFIGEQSEETSPSRPHECKGQRRFCNEHHHPGTSTHRAACTFILTQDAKRLHKAREFMLEICAIHLGILGRDIIQKIESAQCAHSLASLAGQWTMALCASKTASRYAQLYLEQLKLILFEDGEEIFSSHLR